MKHTFKSGLVVEGTIDELKKVAVAIGETLNLNNYHYSKSKDEWVLLSSMSSPHLRNALCLIASEFYKNLQSKPLSDKEFCKEFTSLTGEEVIKLYNELARRG